MLAFWFNLGATGWILLAGAAVLVALLLLSAFGTSNANRPNRGAPTDPWLKRMWNGMSWIVPNKDRWESVKTHPAFFAFCAVVGIIIIGWFVAAEAMRVLFFTLGFWGVALAVIFGAFLLKEKWIKAYIAVVVIAIMVAVAFSKRENISNAAQAAKEVRSRWTEETPEEKKARLDREIAEQEARLARLKAGLPAEEKSNEGVVAKVERKLDETKDYIAGKLYDRNKQNPAPTQTPTANVVGGTANATSNAPTAMPKSFAWMGFFAPLEPKVSGRFYSDGPRKVNADGSMDPNVPDPEFKELVESGQYSFYSWPIPQFESCRNKITHRMNGNPETDRNYLEASGNLYVNKYSEYYYRGPYKGNPEKGIPDIPPEGIPMYGGWVHNSVTVKDLQFNPPPELLAFRRKHGF
jgi:hypothetical protein